ncbi:MAG TPA: hypothetical protein VNF99_11555 [Stellaceae bacterium]|nr:hypothetical protein [Stellaceae bacterium]
MRIFACAAAGSALAALGWCLPDLHSGAAEGMTALVGRSIGLALFGVAMVAAGLVFRIAMKPPKAALAPVVRPATGEFRRGFAARGKAPPARKPSEGEVVVALRRAVAGQGQMPQQPPPAAPFPPRELERLQDLLHRRAAQMRARKDEQAKRRFLHSGVDIHGLARS